MSKYKRFWVSLGGFEMIIADGESPHDIADFIHETVNECEADIDEVKFDKELTLDEVKVSGSMECSPKVEQEVWGKQNE